MTFPACFRVRFVYTAGRAVTTGGARTVCRRDAVHAFSRALEPYSTPPARDRRTERREVDDDNRARRYGTTPSPRSITGRGRASVGPTRGERTGDTSNYRLEDAQFCQHNDAIVRAPRWGPPATPPHRPTGPRGARAKDDAITRTFHCAPDDG